MSEDQTKAARVTRRRGETRRRMLDAAFEVFAEQGFGHASVEDVCTRAGYTRGAFYSNFVSLDELFLAMWQERSDADLAEIEAGLEGRPEDDPGKGIDRWLENVAIGEDWFRIQAEFAAHALRTPGLREVIAAREARIAELLLRVVGRALEAAGRRILDPEAFAAALVAVHDGTAIQILMEPDSALARRRRRKLFHAVVVTYTEVDE